MDNAQDSPAPPQLTPAEARILGSLVEKAATTPDVYPLTLNNIVLACNQKTAREPVTNLSPGEIGHALRQLEPRGLVKSEYGARSERYHHRLDKIYDLTPAQSCLIALLLLRGPQTLHELLARSERQHRFAGIDDVKHALDRLAERDAPLVRRLPRGAGQREDRYAHLLCGEPAMPERGPEPAEARTRDDGAFDALLARIEALEERVAALEVATGSDAGSD
ncbi:YceH family protein [Lysobacter hankyongensis]|uniref:DUF480 domain-containing protein n=1 Tax=Lysobacter hankyongensis TaxID=1176535 RepID=A0ABP9BE03_9GAMM